MSTTITAPQTERISLYFREGLSDKVYQTAIEPQGELFVVNFAFGRRGSTLNTGTKTLSPLDYATAKRIYDKLVREKMAKGYTQGPDGASYQHTEQERRISGILPQRDSMLAQKPVHPQSRGAVLPRGQNVRSPRDQAVR